MHPIATTDGKNRLVTFCGAFERSVIVVLNFVTVYGSIWQYFCIFNIRATGDRHLKLY